ncbi:L-type lectin-domain containing receptor kinase S.4 [Linum perenne]
MLSSGKRLHSWVDYQAGSKRLEVRLSQFGEVKPLDSLLSYPIDLSRMWSNDQEVLICLSSSNGNASQSSFLYSWSFQLRQFPHWMHSQPLDPNGFDPKLKPVVVDVRRGDCGMKVIAALIMGVGFGALGAFMGVNLCNMLIKWPEECSLSSSSSSSSSSSVHPVDFEYEKVKVVTVDDKVFKDGK